MTTPTTVEPSSRPVSASAGPRRGERDRLIARAKALSWLSLTWMTVEGTVAIVAALIAGSVALLGFGIDSAIEGLASVIVIWRFTGARRLAEQAERRAQKAVAISFFDPVVALVIAAIALREGGQAWAGEACTCAAVLERRWR